MSRISTLTKKTMFCSIQYRFSLNFPPIFCPLSFFPLVAVICSGQPDPESDRNRFAQPRHLGSLVHLSLSECGLQSGAHQLGKSFPERTRGRQGRAFSVGGL